MSNEEIVRRLIEAENNGWDLDTALSLLSEDFVAHWSYRG